MKKILFIIFLITTSCSNNKVVNNHGINAIELKGKKIEINVSSKEDVLNIIGYPSSISIFDENTWVYIERELVNQSVLKLGKTKLEKNYILEVTFNDTGIVKYKKFYDLNDMNDLEIAKETTNKKFETGSKLGKLIKSLEQKINSPKKNRKR
tara:strand:- start:358 stop:813 length:456 start_codon:yes stop_codon:yes gene_type:complete